MQTDFHTVIVGAGPSGTAAATLLAQAGKSVCVVDKATFPRDKCCGDGLTTLALRELEKIGFAPSTVLHGKPFTVRGCAPLRVAKWKFRFPVAKGNMPQWRPASTSMQR